MRTWRLRDFIAERGEVVLEVSPEGFEFVGAGYRVNTTCLGIPEGRYEIRRVSDTEGGAS